MGRDKSKQGFIDKDIGALIGLINKSGYKTTSSCSGRIVLLKIPKFGDKQHAEWLYKTHENADSREIMKILEENEGLKLYFLQEPPIIHVNCRDMESADK